MKTLRTMRVVICTLALVAGPATSARAQDKKKSPPPPPATITTAETAGNGVRTQEHLIEVTATVMGIDLAKREVTLKGPEGNIETVEVGPKVERITEIQVGDQVNVQYYLGVAAELRAPTEEEKKEPFKIMEDGARAPKTSAPAGMAARVIRVVATIEAIDPAAQTVTLKGPKGRYHTVQVQDPAVMQKVKKGDTVIVTAAEALAISLEKTKKAEKPK